MAKPVSVAKPRESVEGSAYVTLPSGRLFVRTGNRSKADAGDRPTLVFLHEALGCDTMWKDVPEALSEATGLPFLTYDRLGHGRSDPLPLPRDELYLEVEAFEVLPAVLESCGVSEPVLIGHSDGGTIALMYASRHRVRGVVTEAAHVFLEELTLASIRNAVGAWQTTGLRDRLARHHGDKTEELFEAWASTCLSEAFRPWNIEPCLSGVQAPVLVVQGEEDEYGTVRQVEAIVAGVSGPATPLLFPDCRHVPHLQAADRVLPAVADFVNGLLEH